MDIVNSIKSILGSRANAKEIQNFLKEITPIIDEITESGDIIQLKAIVTELGGQSVPLLFSWPLLTLLISEIEKLPPSSGEMLARHIFYVLDDTKQSYEEQVATVIIILAELCADRGDIDESIDQLDKIKENVVNQVLSDEFKARFYIIMARVYLESDESEIANSHLNRASSYILQVDDGPRKERLNLEFQKMLAKITDRNLMHLEAASKYYRISHKAGVVEQQKFLQNSLSCAFLSEAGPQRNRMLGTLFNDERCQTLEHFELLRKAFLYRIIRKDEVSTFNKSLSQHQKVSIVNGLTLLERAVIEHNVISASRVYENIQLTELARILGIEYAEAEKVTANMVSEERLQAKINQVTGLVHFKKEEPEIQRDEKIRIICSRLNSTADEICVKHNEFLSILNPT